MAQNNEGEFKVQSSPSVNKQYGAYKVSEYTHGNSKSSYRVEEKEGVPAR